MTNTKTTKRALLASVLSVLMCISMLIGSTFAWFTDTASTAVNSIQSGTIDIRLTDLEGNNMEGKTLNWIDANGNTDILWEPGCTFITEPVTLWNYSNLSFALSTNVTGFSGDTKLLEAIEWKIADYDKIKDDQGNLKAYDEIDDSYLSLLTEYGGFPMQSWQYGLQADWTTDSEGVQSAHPGVGQPKPIENVCIVAHMKEEADNEYQGLTLTGAALTFKAAQLTDEHDSYDNEYDKDAEYPADPADAQKMIDEATDGTIIVLAKGTYEQLVIGKNRNIKNLTIVGEEGAVVKGIFVDTKSSALTIDGLTIKNIDFQGKGLYFDCAAQAPFAKVSNLTMEDCTMTGTGTDVETQNIVGNRLFDIGADSTGSNQFTNIVIKNCSVSNAVQGIRLGSLYGENLIANNTISNVGHNAITLRTVQGGTTTVSANTISNGADRAFRSNTIAAGATVKFENNVITSTGDNGSNWKVNTNNGTVTFTGNTVDGAGWDGNN